MTARLDGRVALVSGSGRGIGREIALKLASEGARIVVNDLDADPAAQTAEMIRDMGGEAAICAGSVTEDGFAQRFVDTGVNAFGGLDIIVNNAGYTWDSVVQKMTDEQWHAIIDVHLTWYVRGGCSPWAPETSYTGLIGKSRKEKSDETICWFGRIPERDFNLRHRWRW